MSGLDVLFSALFSLLAIVSILIVYPLEKERISKTQLWVLMLLALIPVVNVVELVVAELWTLYLLYNYIWFKGDKHG